LSAIKKKAKEVNMYGGKLAPFASEPTLKILDKLLKKVDVLRASIIKELENMDKKLLRGRKK